MRPGRAARALRALRRPGRGARRRSTAPGATLAEAAAARALSGREDETLLARLTAMVVKRGGARLAGRAIPGFAIVVNAIGNEQAARELADRAIAFYGG